MNNLLLKIRRKICDIMGHIPILGDSDMYLCARCYEFIPKEKRIYRTSLFGWIIWLAGMFVVYGTLLAIIVLYFLGYR